VLLPLRDDFSFSAPRQRVPAALVALVLLNAAVFLFEWALPPSDQAMFAHLAGMIPLRVTHGEAPLTVVTAMFVHGGVLHLVGNMWFLWVFGQRLANAMGAVRFLLFYLACGVIAAAVQVAADPSSTVPMIGASGAVAGVLGGYMRAWPRARVRSLVFLVFLFFIWTLPAWWVLGLWFLGQFASAASGGPGVAWFAHIGGFAFGWLVVRAFMKRRPPAPVSPVVVYPLPR
jgi:rhomboid family protein